jgi:hypothetical protein
MVLTVPHCEFLTNGKQPVFRFKNGLYLQQEAAKKMLEDFRH